MKMMKCILALAMCLVFLCAAAVAEVSGINVMSVYVDQEKPVAYFEVRAQDSIGTGQHKQSDDFRFMAEGKELTASAAPQGSLGHIIVVDTSMYYYNIDKVKSSDIQGIITAYLSRLTADEKILFVLASDSAQPMVSRYMTLSEAKEYVKGITLSKEPAAKINTAIYEAFKRAIVPAQNEPMFKSVFIVADPDLVSNGNDNHGLDECVRLRADSGVMFDVSVATVYRSQFMETSSKQKELREGFNAFESFATQMGGRYVTIPQTDKGVETSNLFVEFATQLYTSNQYMVDFSALSGVLPAEPQVQKVDVTVSCDGAMRTVTVELDTALLPVVETTATPEPLPGYTPAPTPVVIVGQRDSYAVNVMRMLKEYFYLEKSNFNEFDNEALAAYMDFCELNGITPKEEGIFSEEYELLMSKTAVRKPTQTPPPTPTPSPSPSPTPSPAPEVPVDGYQLNDTDAQYGGDFIAQMQSILKQLNCYEEGTISNPGRLDQATLDAVNRYCEAYNWSNQKNGGVDYQIVQDILKNGANKKPIEFTMQEKAMAFLGSTLTIGGMQIKTWVPVVACVALLFLIIVICIVLGAGKEKASNNEEEEDDFIETPRRQGRGRNHQPAQEEDEVTVDAAHTDIRQGSVKKPLAVSGGRAKIMLIVRFNGREERVNAEISENIMYTIGRKDCNLKLSADDDQASRLHANLYIKNGRLYLQDVSRYSNTFVNSIRVRNQDIPNAPDYVVVNYGDEIQIAQHSIHVKW